jgi:hypothetical protein
MNHAVSTELGMVGDQNYPSSNLDHGAQRLDNQSVVVANSQNADTPDPHDQHIGRDTVQHLLANGAQLNPEPRIKVAAGQRHFNLLAIPEDLHNRNGIGNHLNRSGNQVLGHFHSRRTPSEDDCLTVFDQRRSQLADARLLVVRRTGKATKVDSLVSIAADFGCDAIGIQYQQGLKDMTPASDLVEGLLNNSDRPPVVDREGRELYAGLPLPHFNEVDECAGLDALVTNRVWRAMHLDPATTLHDVRWGEQYRAEGLDDFIWLFQISGAAPASHFIDGYAGAISERQPPMYFRLGGGTLKGIGKPGELVWSRVFLEAGKLHVDIGRATALQLPGEETNRRWAQVTPQWPIVHARLHGVTRDQFMARHRANHLNVAYATSEETANKALAAKAIMMAEMGITVHLCGGCLDNRHQ